MSQPLNIPGLVAIVSVLAWVGLIVLAFRYGAGVP